MAVKKVRASYLRSVLDPESRDIVLAWVFKHAKSAKENHGVDGIAFRGMSGAIVAPTVADRLNLPLIMLRKPTVNQHSTAKLEGYRLSRRILVIDDLVASGDTMLCLKNILFGKQGDEDNMWKPNQMCVVAVILYAAGDPDYTQRRVQEIFDDMVDYIACGTYSDVTRSINESWMDVRDMEIEA